MWFAGVIFMRNLDLSYLAVKVQPDLKFNHVPFKESLKVFAKLHPGLMGREAKLQDGLFNQCSLSVRVLLGFFKKCASSPTAWETAKRNYNFACNLNEVSKVLEKVKVTPKDKAKFAKAVDWEQLQEEAPKLPFWEVCKRRNS